MNNKKMLMVFMAFFIGLSGIMISFRKDKQSDAAAIHEDNIIKESSDTGVSGGKKDGTDGKSDITYDGKIGTNEQNGAGSTDEDTYNNDSDKEVCVYICGCVNNPGVYTLNNDDRLVHAVDAAGGVTKEAAVDVINLAMPVSDGMKIYVPSVDEVNSGNYKVQSLIEEGNSDGQSGGKADGKSDGQSGKANDGTSGGTSTGTTDGSGSNDGEKVNINTADSNELMTLSGIGSSRADAIIAYRQENGYFQKIEDIMNVSGIKNSLFERIRDYITI